MNKHDSIVTRRLKICGRVQGVGFRAFVKHQADKLKLNGFVRNCTDETVEVVACGEESQVESLIVLCHGGPPSSRVQRVEVEEEQLVTEPGFKQLPTL